MSRNYYSEINLHLVWHTKLSMPLLTAEFEPFIHRFLREQLVLTDGVFVHEVGGIETHVHVVVSINPTGLISDLVGDLKGSSAYAVNQQFGRGEKVLQWQAGYGVVSFGTRDLEWVKAYVRNQRAHHAGGTARDRLERIFTAKDAARRNKGQFRAQVNDGSDHMNPV